MDGTKFPEGLAFPAGMPHPLQMIHWNHSKSKNMKLPSIVYFHQSQNGDSVLDWLKVLRPRMPMRRFIYNWKNIGVDRMKKKWYDDNSLDPSRKVSYAKSRKYRGMFEVHSPDIHFGKGPFSTSRTCKRQTLFSSLSLYLSGIVGV